MIHLDANYLIDFLKGDLTITRQLKTWIVEGRSIHSSAIAWSEFLCGPIEPAEIDSVRQMIGQIIELTETDALLAAKLFNQTGRRSRSLADCMIAAIAIRTGAFLATSNSSDFKSFRTFGLKIAQP